MDTQISLVQRTYEIINNAHAPITATDINVVLKKEGRKIGTTVYNLLDKGYIKKAGEKDGRTSFVVTGATPEFHAARKYRKAKKMARRAAKLALITAHTEEVAEVAEDPKELIAHSYNASAMIQNAAALLKFAVLLEMHGPDKVAMILAGLDRMARVKI